MSVVGWEGFVGPVVWSFRFEGRSLQRRALSLVLCCEIGQFPTTQCEDEGVRGCIQFWGARPFLHDPLLAGSSRGFCLCLLALAGSGSTEQHVRTCGRLARHIGNAPSEFLSINMSCPWTKVVDVAQPKMNFGNCLVEFEERAT